MMKKSLSYSAITLAVTLVIGKKCIDNGVVQQLYLRYN